MIDRKDEISHKLKNDVLRFQSIVELLLFEKSGSYPLNKALKDGDTALENIKKYWEYIKERKCDVSSKNKYKTSFLKDRMSVSNGNLQLYSNHKCPYAQRVRILLNLFNLDCEIIEIDLQNKPEYFKNISPFDTVPVLRDSDLTILESHLINFYISDKYGGKTTIFPDKNPASNYFVSFYTEYYNNFFCNNYYNLLTANREEDRKNIIREINDVLLFLHERLFNKISSTHPYFLGQKISLLDVNLFPHMERFLVAGYYRGASIPPSCMNIISWFENLIKVESFYSTLRSFQFYKEYFQKYKVPTFDDSKFLKINGWE